MNRPEVYERSVSVLLDAYNTGKLRHGACEACAVGNLLGTHIWGWDFSTCVLTGEQRDSRDSLASRLATTLDVLYNNSGYTRDELKHIEFVFEMGGYEYLPFETTGAAEIKKKRQYLGLVAVLDALREIHEVDVDTHEEKSSALKSIATQKHQLEFA